MRTIFKVAGLAAFVYGGFLVLSNAAFARLTEGWENMDPANADVDVVARTLWGEARGEGAQGMYAVANVIANRVARPGWWGTDWRSVCLSPRQFSCWNLGDPNRVKLIGVTEADPEFRQALAIARSAVAGTLEDITGGATHYAARSIENPWGLRPVADIGGHIFYA